MTPAHVELFAGPGGISEGMRRAGHPGTVAVELARDACTTANAAGHPRIRGDVYGLDPRRVAPGPVGWLTGAPPCQGFSPAGLKAGRDDLDAVLDLVTALGDGHDDCRGDHLLTMKDHRSVLVAEPLRWAVALEPEHVLLEQVPAVLPVWEAIAEELEARSYWTDVAVLNAADFGVPQDRERAILVASRVRPVHLDAVPRLPHVGADTVLGPGILGFPRRNDRPDGGAYRARDMRRTERPAFTITEKARSWTLVPDDGPPRQITPAEAGQLQSFPADYPWQGTRSAQFLQVANCTPPALVEAIVRAVHGITP